MAGGESKLKRNFQFGPDGAEEVMRLQLKGLCVVPPADQGWTSPHRLRLFLRYSFKDLQVWAQILNSWIYFVFDIISMMSIIITVIICWLKW